MSDFIQNIINEIKRNFYSSKVQTTKKWSYLIPLIIVFLLAIIGEYVLLLPIHYQSQTFVFHLIFLITIRRRPGSLGSPMRSCRLYKYSSSSSCSKAA